MKTLAADRTFSFQSRAWKNHSKTFEEYGVVSLERLRNVPHRAEAIERRQYICQRYNEYMSFIYLFIYLFIYYLNLIKKHKRLVSYD